MPVAPVVLYRAAPGAGFNHAQAQRYGSYLTEQVGLGERPVAPEEVVEAARPKRSPLHDAFTWDNRTAAERYRVQEARHLISHIVISTPADPDIQEAEVRAFHNVTASNGEEIRRGYMTSEVVWRTPDLAEQVIASALRDLRGWTKRYRVYGQLAHLVEQVDRLLQDEAA